jgi:pyridoxine kinase
VLLSNHPGLGKPAGQSTSVTLIEEMFAALTAVGAFDGLAAVMTGYFTSAAQVIAVAKQIATLKALNHNLHVLVDPVIGDHGQLYVGQEVAEAIRDEMLPLATITTPNVYELQWLAGTTDLEGAVKVLGRLETIITSVPEGDNQLATELHMHGYLIRHVMPRFAVVPNGTGDFLAGCYLAERLTQSPEVAFEKAMQRLGLAISRSAGSPALKLS